MLPKNTWGDPAVNNINSANTDIENLEPEDSGLGAPLPSVISATPSASLSVSQESLKRWGRVDDEGNVYLVLPDGEKVVGQYPDASKDEALKYFIRKYEDILAQVNLISQRITAEAPAQDLKKSLTQVKQLLSEGKAVGDIPSLLEQLELQEVAIDKLHKKEEVTREKDRNISAQARAAIVVEAEKIVEVDINKIQWKQSGKRMSELFEEWKYRQKNDTRIAKPIEEELWKRFRVARNIFDKKRRQYFLELDEKHKVAKVAKEKIVARAQELAQSTDWVVTANEFRLLMDQWKSTDRTNKKDDDLLWESFRNAQNSFFTARRNVNEALDKEYAENLVVKENILVEAEKILPVTDIKLAKKSLRNFQKLWEEAGKVPRADMVRVEGRFKDIERAVKSAEDDYWRLTNPETKARTHSALSQISEVIAELEEKLVVAKKSGNNKKVTEIETALQARVEWLEQIQQAAKDLQ